MKKEEKVPSMMERLWTSGYLANRKANDPGLRGVYPDSEEVEKVLLSLSDALQAVFSKNSVPADTEDLITDLIGELNCTAQKAGFMAGFKIGVGLMAEALEH